MSASRVVNREARLLVLLSIALLALPLGSAALASTFTVTKGSDTADGSCDTDCSLREAIVAANANPGADTIILRAGGYVLTIPGSEEAAQQGDLDVLGDLQILGAGMDDTTVDANGIDRAFHARLGTLDLRDLTVQGGNTAGDGGGILNEAALALTRCIVTLNHASGKGGGVCTGASRTTTITNSYVDDNSAGTGGGVFVDAGGTLTVTKSTAMGNAASGSGGGVAATQATVTLERSTIAANSAAAGGGVHQAGSGEGSLNLKNCTVSGNSVSGTGARGGGIHVTAVPTVRIAASTFTGNTAPAGDNGSGIYTDSSVVTLINSLIRGQCRAAGTGSFATQGGNLESPGATCSLGGNDQANVADPMLYQLGDNGGPTPTHAPRNGSPAIDRALNAQCEPIDQRGHARPVDGNADGVARCDVGAFEYLAEPRCNHLTLGHAGSGSDPSVWPPNSARCPALGYAEGTVVELSAAPDPGWTVGGWTGTDDDSSRSATNTVTMPASDHAASVRYVAGGGGLAGGADYDGDGWDDVGVFRNGMWFLSESPDYVGVDVSRAFGSPVAGRDAPEIGEFGCSGAGGADGRSDLVILRKPYSTWMATLSPDWASAPAIIRTFGTTAHKRVSTRRLDTNGDGCSDIGVFRGGCFHILESPGYGPSFRTICFGPGTDEPLSGDLDGDGKSDLILWRASSAHYTYRLSSESYSTDHSADLGGGDWPLVGDLTGDGRDDLGSYKSSYSTFRVTYSPDFVGVDLAKTHGVSGDIPILADVNGDGKADIGVFRSANARWWFLCSPLWTSTCLSQSFGVAGDIPIYGKPPGMP